MSAFKALRDVSNNFEDDLRRLSSELFTTRIDEPYEDVVSKKLKDLTLYTSKLRLMQAAIRAVSSQTSPDEHTIASFTDTVKKKLVEKQVVKTVTQAHHVKALITTPDSSLHPDMVERKEKLIEQLKKFKDKEIQLRHLDTVLREREQRLDAVRREWDAQLGLLRERKADVSSISEDLSSPLSDKLQRLESRLGSLRALLARLAAARGGGYDWLADPRRRLRALQLARQEAPRPGDHSHS